MIYRFIFGFLKLKEEKIITAKAGISGVMTAMKNILKINDVEELFKISFGFSIRDYIKKCEEEYDKVKNDPNNEYMTLLL